MLEGSCGSLSLGELGLSFGKGFGRLSSFEFTSKSSLVGRDGVESGFYEDADLSKTTSRFTRTTRVEGL